VARGDSGAVAICAIGEPGGFLGARHLHGEAGGGRDGQGPREHRGADRRDPRDLRPLRRPAGAGPHHHRPRPPPPRAADRRDPRRRRAAAPRSRPAWLPGRGRPVQDGRLRHGQARSRPHHPRPGAVARST
jgi:hypothetical protein